MHSLILITVTDQFRNRKLEVKTIIAREWRCVNHSRKYPTLYKLNPLLMDINSGFNYSKCLKN
ncbi:hypothetical protein C6497_12030 [Candidatus Poribacteria bacterium]|nr:MAG: hypothetical protein C6497_12030 [Candidatus Poribacteria bacterium]